MELLPIIYTTLLIFAGIAFVTIIGSFISFKIRKKNGWLEQEEATDILETPDIIKNRSQNNSTPRKEENSKKPKHNNSERTSNNSSRNNSNREDSRRSKPSSRDRNREKERYLEEKRISEEKKERAEKEKIRSKDRIQVLNNLNSSKPTEKSDSNSEFSKPSISQKKYNTLGDDIMKNYAGNKDDAFNPLKTKQKKD